MLLLFVVVAAAVVDRRVVVRDRRVVVVGSAVSPLVAVAPARRRLVVARVRVGLEEIAEDFRGPVTVVQVQLDQRVARVLPHVLPEVEDVTAPPLRDLQVRQDVRSRDPLVRGEGPVHQFLVLVVQIRFHSLLRRELEARHLEGPEPKSHPHPRLGGLNPVHDGTVEEDERRVRNHLVELVQELDLRVEPLSVVDIELGEGVDILSRPEQVLSLGQVGEHPSPVLPVIGLQPDAIQVIVDGGGSRLGEPDVQDRERQLEGIAELEPTEPPPPASLPLLLFLLRRSGRDDLVRQGPGAFDVGDQAPRHVFDREIVVVVAVATAAFFPLLLRPRPHPRYVRLELAKVLLVLRSVQDLLQDLQARQGTTALLLLAAGSLLVDDDDPLAEGVLELLGDLDGARGVVPHLVIVDLHLGRRDHLRRRRRRHRHRHRRENSDSRRLLFQAVCCCCGALPSPPISSSPFPPPVGARGLCVSLD
mmetsp:Transcript_18522/g.42745  ORF Transcript_18522/g.42745 Transcript_18522/m.42745 type:complete len:475 (+) Transcript_18522:724-2148(+)